MGLVVIVACLGLAVIKARKAFLGFQVIKVLAELAIVTGKQIGRASCRERV